MTTKVKTWPELRREALKLQDFYKQGVGIVALVLKAARDEDPYALAAALQTYADLEPLETFKIDAALLRNGRN